MTTWRDQLKDGSYKGVTFYVDSHEFTGGKRIVDHIFPYRDLAFTESMGRKQRVFSIDAYILGEDYFSSRDALIYALESEGAGTLVHPYLGNKTVEAVDFRVSESRAEGGIVYLSLTFHETSAKPTADLGNGVIQKAEVVDAKIDKSMLEEFQKFSSDALSDLNVSRLTAIVDKGTDAIYAARNLIPAGDFGISELAFSVGQAKQGVSTLIRRPLELASFVISSANLLKDQLTTDNISPKDQFGRDLLSDPEAFKDAIIEGRSRRAALSAAIDVGATFPSYEGQTLGKLQLKEDTRLFSNLMKGIFISKLASISLQTVYGSYQEAVTQRDYLASQIESLLSDPLISDETYQNFQDLLVIIMEGIPGEFTREERLSTYALATSLPSLPIAYDLYDSLILEGDLISRNHISNPSFFRAGNIEVIAGD